MKTVLALVLAAATAAPALAADPLATPSPSPSVAPAATTENVTQRYCVLVPKTTGTIIDRKVCRTRAEWALRGIDPLASGK